MNTSSSEFSQALSRITPEKALKYLLEILHSPLTNKANLVKILAEIDRELYLNLYKGKSLADINKLLIEKYSPFDISIKDFFLIDINHPFSQRASKLIFTLLLSPCSIDFVIDEREHYVKKDGVLLQVLSEQKITGIYYLANKAMYFFKKMIVESEEVDGIFEHYFPKLNDPAATIGRIKYVYATPFFKKEVNKHFGIDSLEMLKLMEALLLYVMSRSSVISISSFKNIIDGTDNISKVIEQCSSSLPESKLILLSQKEFIEVIGDELRLNNRFRSKPLVKINEEYICIQIALLVDSLSDFIYYFLLTRCRDEEAIQKLTNEFGKESYEPYVNLLPSIANIKEEYEKNPKYILNRSEAEYCDLLIHVDPQTIIMWETKSARGNDEIKKASRDVINKKFIAGEKPAILQLMKHASNYRKNKNFTGDIYTILAYYEAPITKGFDILLENELAKDPVYNEYKNNPKTIWLLNSNTIEMFFSALKQNASIKELICALSKVQSHEVADALKRFINEQQLRYSIALLFENEIAEFNKQQMDLLGLQDRNDEEI